MPPKKPKGKKKRTIKGLALGTALYASAVTGVNHLPSTSTAHKPKHGTTTTVAGKLEIHVLDVGQGDAIFIRCPDGTHDMLIDSGDTRYPNSSANFKKEIQALLSAGSTITYALATHPHNDHIGNMKWVLQNYKVQTYIDNGFEYDSQLYSNLMVAVTAFGSGISYHSEQEGSDPPVIDLGTSVQARILRPAGFQDETGDPNSRSVVIRLDYGKNSFLFVGDCEATEETLLETDPNTKKYLDVDFLKVGHHGSDTSSSVPFLNMVTPKIAVISCGAKGVGTNNGYKHPRAITLQDLEKLVQPRQGSPVTIDDFNASTRGWESFILDRAIYETNAQGELDFESDGKTITLEPKNN